MSYFVLHHIMIWLPVVPLFYFVLHHILSGYLSFHYFILSCIIYYLVICCSTILFCLASYIIWLSVVPLLYFVLHHILSRYLSFHYFILSCIIIRFFSRQTRAEVFRAARAGLRQDGIRIVDDLTRVDWQEKRRVQPLMNKLYKENKRPFFRNGRLYAENRPVPFGLIDNFLSSEEGRAATK